MLWRTADFYQRQKCVGNYLQQASMHFVTIMNRYPHQMIHEFDSRGHNSKSIVSTLHEIDTIWSGYDMVDFLWNDLKIHTRSSYRDACGDR